MKKTILLIAVLSLLFSIIMEAQIKRNTLLISAGSNIMNIGFSSIKHKSDATGYTEPTPEKRISFNLSPEVGFFVANNFAIGLDVSLGLSIYDDVSSKSRYTNLGVGPFLRYYIPTRKVMPVFAVSGSLGTLINNYESPSGNSDNTSLTFSIGGGAGVAIRIGDKVTFDIMAGYSTSSVKSIKNNPNNTRNVIGAIGINLGFEILL
jgi:hypothetical protein